MTTDERILSALQGARDFLGASGDRWMQDEWFCETFTRDVVTGLTCACTMGAIYYADSGLDDIYRLHEIIDATEYSGPCEVGHFLNQVADVLAPHIDAVAPLTSEDGTRLPIQGLGAVTSWNDRGERTYEQVLAVFDAAIADLQAKLA